MPRMGQPRSISGDHVVTTWTVKETAERFKGFREHDICARKTYTRRAPQLHSQRSDAHPTARYVL